MANIFGDRLGFTLIELMVALAVSSLVAAGMVNFFVNMNTSFQNQEQINSAQQNGRIAVEYLTRSIQNAGYNVARGRRFLAASDRYLTTVFDENEDGVIQNTEVITYCLSKRGEGSTENLQIFTYFDRDRDGEVEADEGGNCTIPLALSGPPYNLYQAIPDLEGEGSTKSEIANGLENLIIRYYDQDNQPLPVTRQNPEDPNSERIAPAPPYDFSSVPQELNNIRRIEMELVVRSDKPMPVYNNSGVYPDKTVATYDQSGSARSDVSYADGYYRYSFHINVSPRNLIEAPWGRLILEADPNAVSCSGTSSVIRATLVDMNGDSLANQQISFCVNYDDEDGSPDASIDPNVCETNANGVATVILNYDWSNGPKTFTVSASSVVDIDPGPMADNKTLYNAIAVAFYGLTINTDPNNPPPYEAGDIATFQVSGGTEPYTWHISLAPPNPQTWVVNTRLGFIDPVSGVYQDTNVGTILVQATDNTGCTANRVICPEIVLSHYPQINFTVGETTTFSAAQGTPPYQWRTTSPSIGVIDPNSGAYTQVGNGTTVVMAIDYNGCLGQVSTCPQINITPIDPNLSIGDSITFSVDGGESPYSWSSSNESVGTIQAGLFSAVGYGQTIITVTDVNGCQGQILINTCQSMSIVPASPQYQQGETDTLVSYDGSAPYTWASSRPLVGSIDEYGHFSALSRGQTTITVTDNNGCQGQTIATVCSGLSIDPNTSDYYTGRTVILSASGGEEPYYWASTDAGVATVSSDGTMQTISSGQVTITVTDAYGCQGSLSITVNEGGPLFYDNFFNADNWDLVSGTWSLEAGTLRLKGSSNGIVAIKDSVWNPAWVDYIVVLKLKENVHSSGYDDMDGAIMTRYQAYNRNYKMEMDTDSSGLHLDKWNGGESRLGSAVAFSYQIDKWYYQKVKVQGNQISVKAWKEGDPEPDWLLTRTDSTFATGKVGLRIYSSDVSFDSIAVYPVQ